MRAWLWTLAAAWSVYASSSIQRLAGGDSGELLAEACVGGNAHPPGYPLLLLLLRIVRQVGSFACPQVPFVVLANYFNAACASGAAASVTQVVGLVAGRGYEVEAFAAGLVFAFSALAWEYAIGLEVFALNNLLVGMFLVLFVRHFVHLLWSVFNLCCGALVGGLGLANQHTIVLFEIPMIAWVLATTKLHFVEWTCLVVAFLIGISPYASTFFASQTPIPGSWGNASSITGLLTHVLRREYGTFKLSPIRDSSESLQFRLQFYMTDLMEELTLPGALCAMLGVLGVAMRPQFFARNSTATSKAAGSRSHSPRTSLGAAFCVAFTFYVVAFNSLANLPLDNALTREITRRFFLQPNLIVSMSLGIGLAWLHRMCLNFSKSRIPVRAIQFAALALAGHQFFRNWALFTRSTVAQHDLVRDFGNAILTDLPTDAVLLSYTDIQWNAVRYLQMCEHKRLDIVHLNLQVMAFPWFLRQHKLYPTIVFPPTQPDISTTRSSQGYATYLSQFITANIRRHAIFLDLHGVDESTISADQLLFGELQIFPHGFLWKFVQPAGNSENLVNAWRSYALHLDHSRRFSNLLVRCCRIASHHRRVDIQSGRWEFVVVSIAHDAIYQANLARLGYWLAHGSIQTVAQLGDAVLAFESIQHQLKYVVLRGAKNSLEAITYDLYAVEKNAVVSRQRFQLYLEAYTELSNGDGTNVLAKKGDRLSSLVKECVERRDRAIEVTEAFLSRMEVEQDADVAAVRKGLDALEAKRGRLLTKANKQTTKRRKKS